VLLLCATAGAKADAVTYSYTGFNYTSCDTAYADSFVVATFELAAPLPDDLDLSGQSASLLSWTITDQVSGFANRPTRRFHSSTLRPIWRETLRRVSSKCRGITVTQL
jgi:hypothetical protein